MHLVYCPHFCFQHTLRSAAPGACLTSTLQEFTQNYPDADVAVVVSNAVEDVLPERLIALARQHPLPSLIVITPLDTANLLSFRRTAVDEFVELNAIPAALPDALQRCAVLSAREHLALHVEHVERMGPALRSTFARALREPAAIRTIQCFADGQGVTARTLDNQWRAFLGPDKHSRLEDQLWLIRLLRVLELRSTGTPLETVCRTFGIEVRSLRRACRRFLGCPLAFVSPAHAVAQVLRVKRQLLHGWR
ncbi:MAG: hypothetical protein ACREMA_09110 [Longimicrobiales bacterium]